MIFHSLSWRLGPPLSYSSEPYGGFQGAYGNGMYAPSAIEDALWWSSSAVPKINKASKRSLVISSVAAHRGIRSAFLRACFPVLLLLLVAAGYGITERLSFVLFDPQLGRMRRSEAISLSESLCARIAGIPAEALSVTGHTNAVAGDASDGWHEWYVLCRAGDFQYAFRISADRREAIMIHREEMPDSSLKLGISLDDEALSVSRRNESKRAIQGRRYLALVGFPVPAKFLVGNHGGYDFTYRVGYQPSVIQEDEQKMTRMLRVSLDPKDGSLVYLQNSISRKYARHPQTALTPTRKTPVGDQQGMYRVSLFRHNIVNTNETR